MSKRSRELRERRAQVHADATRLLKKPNLTAEDRDRFDRMMADIDNMKGDIEREERAEALDLELRSTTRPPEAQIGGGSSRPAENPAEQRFAKSFSSWLRYGLTPSERGGRQMAEEDRENFLAVQAERRDMGIGSGAEGGYTVPQGFVYKVETAMKFYGTMLEAGDIMDTATGATLPWPTQNDVTQTGEQIAENNPVTKQDLTFSTVNFSAWKYSTKMIPISIELMQDSAFDLEAYVTEQFATRLGRILNNKFTVGVGTTEPQGIITGATAGVAAAVGSSGNDGSSNTGANSVGTADLVELEFSVDPLYRKNAAYMFHDSTYKSIRQLLDKYGRPLWQPGLSAAAPDTINGYRFFLNNDMAQIGASNKTILFGDLKKYKIRRVRDLRVLKLVERFADYGQIALLGFARYDGQLLDAGTHPVKYLVQHS
jgi:HK97 family phage major capsid protein